MKYGYFDEQHKEYVIDRPDTPAPWANYLGSPGYGAIISNNAGGYSFEKSGANGRILRYIFNSFDQPGRYVYLRDDDTKDYWSASWQPVGKSLDVYKSECHHGTAYTKMYAEYSDIKSEVLYYVPLNKTHEVWKVRVTNNSDRPRNLSAIGYCEFTNDCNYEQDQVNLQYTLFITRTYFMDNNKILQVINENVEKAEINGSKANRRFFALAGSNVASYCGTVFDDYVQPNNVVEGGDFDANYFQHIPYLESFNEEKGTHLVNAGGIHYEPFGIYPGTKATLDELADGDSIAVPNDTTNEARALLLLQDNGIITLKEDAGLTATKNDIVENPYNVDIVELEAAQVPRVKDEVAFMVLNGNYALEAGFSVAKDSIAYEKSDSEAAKTYVNVIAVKEGNENSDKIKALVEVLTSQEIKDYINNTYDGAVIPFE